MSSCLTGNETTVDGLAKRIAAQPGMHELRLDLLKPFDESVYGLCSDPQLLVTCRPRWEGGAFEGSEDERLRVLRRALKAQPGYLDVELGTDEALRRDLMRTCGATRIVVSAHRFEPNERAPMAQLEAADAHILKLAVAVQDSAELLPLLSWRPTKQAIRIGMGPAGRLSRLLYRQFGSPWTYVAAGPDDITASGQLTLAELHRFRVAHPLSNLGLVGGPQIVHSPGERTYNALFSREGLPFRYLNVMTTRANDVMPLLRKLAFVGLSVTMPAKQPLAQHATLADAASRALVTINTLRLGSDGSATGYNTDVDAISELVRDTSSKTAMVLGAGGAAAAAVYALQRRAFTITICSRSEPRGHALAARFDSHVRWRPWAERVQGRHDVVINTTPCGADGDESPLPVEVIQSDQQIIDALLATEPTALVRGAQSRGARVYDGLDWWVRQGARQLHRLANIDVEAATLRTLAQEGDDTACPKP